MKILQCDVCGREKEVRSFGKGQLVGRVELNASALVAVNLVTDRPNEWCSSCVTWLEDTLVSLMTERGRR